MLANIGVILIFNWVVFYEFNWLFVINNIIVGFLFLYLLFLFGIRSIIYEGFANKFSYAFGRDYLFRALEESLGKDGPLKKIIESHLSGPIELFSDDSKKVIITYEYLTQFPFVKWLSYILSIGFFIIGLTVTKPSIKIEAINSNFLFYLIMFLCIIIFFTSVWIIYGRMCNKLIKNASGTQFRSSAKEESKPEYGTMSVFDYSKAFILNKCLREGDFNGIRNCGENTSLWNSLKSITLNG